MSIKSVVLRLYPRRKDVDKEKILKNMTNEDLLNYVKNNFSPLEIIAELGYNYAYRCKLLDAKWLRMENDHILPIEFRIRFDEDVSDEDFLDHISGDSLEDGVYGSYESNGWINYVGRDEESSSSSSSRNNQYEEDEEEEDVFIINYRRNDIDVSS
jgi:hypothetical protein